MTTMKSKTLKMIQNLPDDCTYEDIQYHLYVVEKNQKGLQRAKDSDVVSHQNAKERMAKWL